MKNNFSLILIAILSFLLGIYVISSCGEKYKPKQEVKIVTDTLVVEKKITKVIEKIKPITVVNETLTTQLDTTISDSNATIQISAMVEIDTVAKWFMDVKFQTYEKLIRDTVKIYDIIETVKPFQNGTAWYEKPYLNFIAGVVITIIIALGL